MIYYLVDALFEVFKGLVVSRQGEFYIQLSYLLQRRYIPAEWVFYRLRVYADIGRNFRQDVVAGKQDFFGGLIQTDMPGGMTGRPYYAEGESAEVNYVAVIKNYIGRDRGNIVFQAYGGISQLDHFLVGQAVRYQQAVRLLQQFLHGNVPRSDGVYFEAVHGNCRPGDLFYPPCHAVMVWVDVGNEYLGDVFYSRPDFFQPFLQGDKRL